MPGAGKLSSEQLREVSKSSRNVLNSMGPQIQWVHSYVTDDKIYCIYNAPDVETVKEHARQSGFPANAVNQVRTIIDPVTAE